MIHTDGKPTISCRTEDETGREVLPRMTTYSPDSWVILRIDYGENEGIIYKILGGWSGSYLSGSSWRMNSGITKIEQDGDYYRVYGFSGSVYRVHKDMEGLRLATGGVYNALVEKFGEKAVKIVNISDAQKSLTLK